MFIKKYAYNFSAHNKNIDKSKTAIALQYTQFFLQKSKYIILQDIITRNHMINKHHIRTHEKIIFFCNGINFNSINES